MRHGKLKKLEKIPTWAWPLIVIALVLLVMLLAFGTTFFTKNLWETLRDPKWWAEDGLSFVFFGLFVGWVASWFHKIRADRAREPYEGWMLHITGLKVGPELTVSSQRLYWREVESFFHSEFEMWKFVKSAISSYAEIKTRNLEDAKKQKWFKAPDWEPKDGPLREEDRQIVLAIGNLTEADIAKWRLSESDGTPDNWEWIEVEENEENEEKKPVKELRRTKTTPQPI